MLQILRKETAAKWSKTLRSWYIYNNPTNLKQIFTIFKDKTFVDATAVFNKKEEKPRLYEKRNRVISEEKKQVVRNFVQYLRGKRYSESTVKTYFTFVANFVEFVNKKAFEEVSNEDVVAYVNLVFVPKKYSISTHRQFVSAIIHFRNFYKNTKIGDLQLMRPRKSTILPTVLSQKEVLSIIQNTRNLKHRAILALIYSAGLRVGEVIDLKLENISTDRRQLLIQNAKGRKDRYVVLAESFLPLLKNYYVSYKPKIYFIEGQNKAQYSASSIRAFLKRSCKRAGIIKKVTPHTLRHSFATHLLENGIGLRYIQELLGHAKPETTMIYTHVAKKDILQIESPLDIAVKKFKENSKDNDSMRLSGNV